MNISLNAVLSALYVVAPCFYTTDELVLERYEALYDLLLCQINPNILSCCGVLVFAFLMAHYLSLYPNTGIARDLKEGELSVGFNVDPTIDFLLLSPYGRAYVDLIKRTVVGSTVTNLPLSLGGVVQNNPVTAGCCGGGYGWGGGFQQ
jgi:hypothetical protein